MRFSLGMILILTLGGGAAEPFASMDEAVEKSIAAGEMPGCVILVLHQGEVKHRKAYGDRAKLPVEEKMTVDTIFDLASLTKPIATATSIWKLIEDGKLKLDDPVAKYWPEFAANGKDKVTIEHCLLHTSGLTADNAIKDYESGRKVALERIANLKLEAPAGTRFRYSDVGFIVLGELVERISGEPLDRFWTTHIGEPLGLTATNFAHRYKDIKLERFAPTEKAGDRWLRGTVHDPRASRLGGVAGHAGLFSNADDLAKYCRMLLNNGEYNGRRILKTETVKLMTEPVALSGGGLRTRGWDCDTGYSRNRGEVFPKGKSFGHTGFTGTSIWIDPTSQTTVIFLSNRLHPSGKGNVSRIRATVATLAAKTLGLADRPAPSASGVREVQNGIDVLAAEKFARLKGKRIGLVTNHTGRSLDGTPTIDLLHQAEGVKLVALFSPEHGIRGVRDEKIGDSKDEKTGLPIYSLYGERRKPDAKTLEGIDTLVYDIQDIGCRFYTYISTLGLVLESAAEHQLKVYVLDRPNPIGGVEVSGPVLDAGKESFVAWHRLPVRHGLTVGELALLFNAERRIGADLEVVPMTGWTRGMLFDQTGQMWINPSPNMRSLEAALLYPGVGLLETTNISVGRGTERPFEWIGAPWIDGRKLASRLAAKQLPGVRFVPANLTPSSSVHAKKECGGVSIYVDDWSTLEPLRVGLTLALTLRELYPNNWKPDRYNRLLGHDATFNAVRESQPVDEIVKSWQNDLKTFRAIREKYLLYK